MVVQSLIALAITIIETWLAGFSIVTIFSILARLMFIAKFQGFKVTPIVIMVMEGSGLVIYILWTSFFKSFVIFDFIVYLLASIIFIIQVLWEENTKVMIDIKESELEDFMKGLNRKD